MSDLQIPAYLRLVAQQAIAKLETDGEGHIEMEREHFAKLCHFAGIEPTKGSACDWIRIEDELCNSVDIQTPVNWMGIIGEPLRKVYSR